MGSYTNYPPGALTIRHEEKTLTSWRLAIRQLVRYPAFSAMVILTLTLGIAASALIFSVVKAVLLTPLPYPDSEQIVRVREVNAEGGLILAVGDPNFRDLKEQSRSFAAFAQFDVFDASVAGGDEPVRVTVSDVSREFFDALGVYPAEGRTFLPEELTTGAAPAALISHGYWQRYLGGSADFASRSIEWNDRRYAIVGVMPPGFDYPDGADIWAPRELWPELPRTAHNYQAVGRLATGIALEEARAELSGIAARLKDTYGADTDMADVSVVSLHEYLVGGVRPALLILSGAAALLLLVAAVNALSLLLARTTGRAEELAVRAALGAARWRITQQFFAEALLLTGVGAVFGIAIAWAGIEALIALDVTLLPRVAEVDVGWSVAAFAAGLAVAIAAGLSLVTAWHSPGVALVLRAGGRGVPGGRRSRGHDALVAVQVAIAFVLLVGTALLARSFVLAANVDPGFRTDGALFMNIATAWPGQDPALRARSTLFFDALFDRLRELPGVETVGAVSVAPLRFGGPGGVFVEQRQIDEIRNFDDFDGLSRDAARTGLSDFVVASEDYFATLDIPLLRGRTFRRSDGPDAGHVALVSRSLAESRWPGQDPIGKLIQYGNMDGDLTPFTIVGIVGDVRHYGLESDARPTFYAYYRQRQSQFAWPWIVVRAPNSVALMPAMREIVRALDPDVPAEFIRSEELFAGALAERRFNLAMLGTFSGTALLLALAGIYAAFSFHVAQRTQEIGVRMALGAQRQSVIAIVLGRTALLAGIGIVVGVVVAFGASRLVSAELYGVAPHDPFSYITATLVLLIAALAAGFLPAMRAARVDPVTALRRE